MSLTQVFISSVLGHTVTVIADGAGKEGDQSENKCVAPTLSSGMATWLLCVYICYSVKQTVQPRGPLGASLLPLTQAETGTDSEDHPRNALEVSPVIENLKQIDF